jgi:hypothetical protein
MAHGLAVDPGSGTEQCGATGTRSTGTTRSTGYTAAGLTAGTKSGRPG